MSERYSKLFALPENLYATGSPVVIAAGALLKDNQIDRIMAQLKLQSISSKAIKAVKVKLDTKSLRMDLIAGIHRIQVFVRLSGFRWMPMHIGIAWMLLN